MFKPVFILAYMANIILLVESFSDESYEDECGPDEIFVQCPDTVCVPKTCAEVGYPVPCVDLGPDGKCPSKPACICKEGYVRNRRDICIPMRKCPSCGGDCNAVSGCGVNCGKHCSDYFGNPRPCPKICNYNGCDCKENFYYDDNVKKCVRPENCTNCNKPNEEYVDCFYDCPPQTCESLDRAYICPVHVSCNRGCRCKTGYYRNLSGECISEADCTTCSQRHEIYDYCPSTCPPQTCESIGKIYHCPLKKVNSSNCQPACRCEKNYLRNKVGECISKDDCLKCTGPHEYYSCGGKACGCYCEQGYVRAENNTCIPIDRSHEPQCPLNEKYEDCPAALCTPQKCSQLGYPIICPAVEQNSACPGQPGCICIDGYVRSGRGVCIPIKQCPSCGGDKNAESGCGFECGKHCMDLYNDEPRVCALICRLNGCQCKPGKYYDEVKKKCVDPENCTKVCRENEVVSECVNGGCDKRNCSQLGQPELCIDPSICKIGCVCRDGYLRHPNGTCVPIKQCPQICGHNEVYDCIEPCKPTNCSQLGYPVVCANYPADYCDMRCHCKDGYLRAANGTCIPVKNCPSCGGDTNAVAGCGINCNRHCSDIGKEPQFCIEVCYENACDCKKGLYLDDNTGKCVPSQNCTPTCGENEVYNGCIQGQCGPKKCSDLGQSLPCPRIDPRYCIGGCLCKLDYVRADNGTCIPKKQCPLCGGDPNAEAGCGVNCNRHCSDIGKKPHPCPDICNINGCDCKEGLYLDDNTDKCVRAKDCTPTCGKDEVYNGCIQGQCGPKKCSDLGKPLPCPKIDPAYCIGGCLCKKDYVRTNNGTCIPKKKCPTCRGDPNAEAGCGLNCNRHCSDIGKKPHSCPFACELNGCECKDGLYFDDNTGKCVLPDDCTPVCGNNEIYTNCTQAHCGPKYCSDLGIPIPCPDIDHNDCTNGCICRDGYVWEKNGTCIPKKHCPTCRGDPNAEAGCGLNCNRHCSDIGKKPHSCPFACELNGCECKDGLYFDDNTGKCVLPDDCTPVCGKNEIYTHCTQARCGPKECSDLGIPIPCPDIDRNCCTEGCICHDGYVLAKNGTCIPKKHCPSCGGDPNAESGCGVNCNKKCSDVGKKKPGPCILICYDNACDCKDGFYYDINYKKCVPPQNCTLQCTSPHEHYDPCPSICPPQTCESIGKKYFCPRTISCKPACRCDKNYFRNKRGICVSKKECSGPPIDIDTGLANLRKGNIAVTGEFIYLYNQLHPGDSFVLSAISVLIAYAQLALYAFGQTLEQLLKATNLSSKDEIREVFPVLIKNYQVQTTASFELVVKTYGNINYPFSKTFKREIIEIFSSDVENVNFSDNVKAADNINNWVKNKTHGLIDKLVSSDMFSADTTMVIVNALYFKDNWKYQFNKNYTQNRDFYITPNKTISIPTMYQERAFNYYESEDLDAQILEMPYDADNFTFVMWLPKQNDGLTTMIEKMRNPDAVIQSLSNFIHTKVRIYMPSMNIETKIDVKDLSIKSNITDMFNPEYADFKGILEKDTPIFISEVVQKAKIIVTETGTEAAAATAVTITKLSAIYPPPEVIIFNANVPFAYSVLYKDDPIFSGVYAGDQ